MKEQKTVKLSFTLQEFIAKNPVKHNKWFIPQQNGDGSQCTVLSKAAENFLASQGLHRFPAPGSNVRNRWQIGAWDILVKMSHDVAGIERDDIVSIIKSLRENMETIREASSHVLAMIDGFLAKEGGAK